MGKLFDAHAYDDIIHMPHHVSDRRPGMSAADRAAQFAPFAALTGYDGVIRETGRLTDECVELDACAKETLNEKLLGLLDVIHTQPLAAFTYFRPDARKSGGSYVTVTGKIKRIDPIEKFVLLTDGTVIPIERIYEIEGDFPD